MCPNEVNDTGVYLEFDGGVGYLYTPPVEGLMSGDELGEILTVEPYASNPEMLAHYILGGRSPDKEAQQMAQALPNHYTFPEENNWDDFSIQQVEQLKRHKIIIWYGHGGYIDRVGSLLGTSVPIDDEDALRTYHQELSNGEMVLGSDAFLLSPLYFDKHLKEGDLDGSLVYLGACSSATDDRLANVFLNKGASLVVGNTRDIFIRYNLYMMCDFVHALTNQYEDGTYWTAEDALQYAKEENGASDSEFWFAGAQVRLIYPLGESGYRLVPIQKEHSSNDEAALQYWQEVLKPQYPQHTEPFTLTYDSIELQGSVDYYESEEQKVALLGGEILDFNGDGIGDLLAVSLERYEPTTPEDLARINGQKNVGPLHYRIEVYCFDEQGKAKLTASRSTQVTPKTQEKITFSLVMDMLVQTNSYDYNAEWNEDSTIHFPVTQELGDHEDHLKLFYLTQGEGTVGLDQMLEYYRNIGHVANYLEAENVCYYSQEEDASLETLYFNGAKSVTTGTNYSTPQVYRQTYGTVSTEEEACSLLNDRLANLGIYGFSIAPYNWDSRWEDTFVPALTGRYPTITLTMESTTSQQRDGNSSTGTTTFTIENQMSLS